jgi:hypothetical protein
MLRTTAAIQSSAETLVDSLSIYGIAMDSRRKLCRGSFLPHYRLIIRPLTLTNLLMPGTQNPGSVVVRATHGAALLGFLAHVAAAQGVGFVGDHLTAPSP